MSTAIAKKTHEDNLSSSPLLTDPAVKKIYDAAAALSTDEAHHALLNSYVALCENVIAYQAYVLDVRRRMHNGEKVGGQTVWTNYADLYLRQADESLPTCMRRLRRVLEGINPDKKHRRKTLKPAKTFADKTNEQLVLEGIDAAHAVELEEVARRKFDEGEAAGMKKAALIAAKKQPTVIDVTPIAQATVPTLKAVETLTATYYVIRNKYGMFISHNCPDEIEDAVTYPSQEAAATKLEQLHKLDKKFLNHAVVKIEASFKLTEVQS